MATGGISQQHDLPGKLDNGSAACVPELLPTDDPQSYVLCGSWRPPSPTLLVPELWCRTDSCRKRPGRARIRGVVGGVISRPLTGPKPFRPILVLRIARAHQHGTGVRSYE